MLPVTVAGTPVCGPNPVPKMAMISPAEMDPVLKLAAFVTFTIVGSGALTVRLTLIVVEPGAPPEPATTIVPVYGVDDAARLSRFVSDTVSGVVPVAGVVPLVGFTTSQLPVEVAVAVKPSAPPLPETLMVCDCG